MAALQFINEQMSVLGINYEFNEWTSDIKYPYFVGDEFREDETITEDGAQTSSLIVVGFNRGKYIDLEEAKEKIKKHFNPVYGLSATTDSGCITVFFADSFNIPSGEADLKKIQFTLKIKEWKGAI
jgi:hypothetical protein